MTAEIIQFGRWPANPNPVAIKVLQRRSPLASKISARAPYKQKAVETINEAVRCTVDGRLYEVEFHGKSVTRISTVHYRHNRRNGRIETLRYHLWTTLGRHNRREPDPNVIDAARRSRGQSKKESDHEMAISQLRERRVRLMRDVEKVEALIAALQQKTN